MPVWGWQNTEVLAQSLFERGFLNTRGSFMLDVVFLAMFLVVPAMLFSIRLAKKGAYAAHKWLQLILGVVLLFAVVAFEVDMRVNGWEHRAEPSPFYAKNGWSAVWYALVVHLAFAVPTFFLWISVITRALLLFHSPPVPGAHSRSHKLWGWLAALGMTGTAFTGCVFYYLAFIAT